MPGANRAYGFLDPNIIAVWALMFTGKRSGANLLACPTATAGSSVGCLAVLYALALAAVAHTCNLCHCLPLVREAMLQVSYLKYCTQAQLTQAWHIGLHKVHHFTLLVVFKLILVQHAALVHHLLNAQQLLTSSVNGKVQVVATALQCCQVIL